jgi:hypothetical protein
MDHEALSAGVVEAIARATDLPLASAADAARIAAGAQSTIDAVRAMGHLELFDAEPADFLPALEQLASGADDLQ